ncbi:MAG: hypothetical protein IT348_14275 [Candidatus Eisenbacteria bacterium]|nr:hypothetical protein [Candidatus Eisenbacteria bacterium]
MRPLACVLLALSLTSAALVSAGCGKAPGPAAPGPSATTRTWRMGFSNIAPVPDQAIAVATIFMWAPRSDGAIAHDGVPWDSLLAGVAPDTLARRQLDLMRYYRATAHLQIVYEADPTDGLAREREDPKLVAAGRSIAEPAIQELYRRWVTAVDTIIHPEYLGLGSEVNLVRVAAPAPVYAALRQMAARTADSLRALHARLPQHPAPQLYATTQVETAWGRLGPPGYQGALTDAADFSFADVWGLSSYPALGGFAEPEDIPLDYYSRLGAEVARPVMVVEGGWASVPWGASAATPQQQARFYRRQAQLLDEARAIGVYNLTFADLALSAWPPPPSGTLVPFARLGLVDSALTAKPALAVWDSLFARTRTP